MEAHRTHTSDDFQEVSHRNIWFLLASIGAALLIFTAYSNHFHNGFHFDDSHVIQNNLYIRSLDNIPNFFSDANTFSSLPSNATFRPLLSTTFAVDYWISGGLNPWAFHVTQFILLMLLGMGLTAWFRFIMDRASVHWWNKYVALFGAVLFCIHTANSETVNYLSSRSSLLATMGVVGSFLLYGYLPRWRPSHLYLAPMMLGLLAKPLAVMFAPLLLVYGLLFEKRLSCEDLSSRSMWPKLRHALGRAMPAFLTGISLFVFVESMNPEGQTYGSAARWQYPLTQPFVWLHYTKLFFLPMGLTADTDWTLVSYWYDTRVLVGVGFILLLLIIVWRCSKTKELRPVAFGLGWYMLGLLPTSSIIPLAEVANEHRVFLPFVGLTLAVTWGVAITIHRWHPANIRWRPWVIPMTTMAMVLVLTSHAVGTYQRNQVWKTEETLWLDVVEKSPNNGRAWMNYGLSQMSKGRYQQAKSAFDRAKTLWPNYAHLETNLGIVTAQIGRAQDAEKHFTRALQLRSDFVGGHYFYAKWLVDQGRAGEAIQHLDQALQISQAYPAARHLLMKLYAAKGADQELQSLVQKTLTMFPEDREAALYGSGGTSSIDSSVSFHALHERGLALMRQGQSLEAALLFRQILKMEPESTEIRKSLARILVSLGLKHAATQVGKPYANRTATVSPLEQQVAGALASQTPSPLNQVHRLFVEGYTHQQNGERDKAIQVYEQILRLDSRHRQVMFNLAYAYLEGATASEWERSVELFHQVLEIDPEYVESLHHLASAYWKLGKRDQAAMYDQAFVEQAPKNNLRGESEQRLAKLDNSPKA